jgi:hypothetical protein
MKIRYKIKNKEVSVVEENTSKLLKFRGHYQTKRLENDEYDP